jgi:hypothetical protein
MATTAKLKEKTRKETQGRDLTRKAIKTKVDRAIRLLMEAGELREEDGTERLVGIIFQVVTNRKDDLPINLNVLLTNAFCRRATRVPAELTEQSLIDTRDAIEADPSDFQNSTFQPWDDDHGVARALRQVVHESVDQERRPRRRR